MVTFGSALEAELDKVTGKNAEVKRQRVIDKWLGRPMKYREPSVTKTVEGQSSPTAAAPEEQQFTVSGDGS